MQPGSNRDRISDAIRLSSRPLDDDQLADRTGISPRQRFNQICRELERAGMVRRRSGPDGKIVNEWLGNEDPKSDSGLTAADADVPKTTDGSAVQPDHELPPGSSREQRDAERVMLDLLAQQLGRELNPAKLAVPSGERVEVDGAGPTRDRRSQRSAIRCWPMPSS
jgi:hypothetical protein